MAHPQPLVVDENTAVPLRVLVAICSLAVSGATIWLLETARIDNADAKISAVATELHELKESREKTLELWHQDRIDNAAFKSAVMTKLDRIEKKIP